MFATNVKNKNAGKKNLHEENKICVATGRSLKKGKTNSHGFSLTDQLLNKL